MTITDDRLTYVHIGHTTIVAAIRSDGSFSGSAQNMYSGGLSTPQGRITGGATQAKTYVGNDCTYS
jgi:hypothetical protein